MGRERAFRRGFASIFSRAHAIGEAALEQHWRVMLRRGGSARVSHRLLRYLGERQRHGPRWEATLESGHVPLHFVWGMADPRSGAHIAREIGRRLPGVPLVALEDVGHYPHLEAPERVAQEIARGSATIPSASGPFLS